MTPAHIARVESLLASWADWMRHETFGRGYPSRSAGLASGGVFERFSDMLEQSENATCVCVDAAIRDLATLHQMAIAHRWLRQVMRAPGDPVALYAEALPGLMRALRARDVGV